MDNIDKRNDIIEVGRELLETKLVARTWGNISAREDEDNFLITPSGLDYITMKDEDIVSVNITSGEWKGNHKPSGERGVHKAAYEVFDDVNFVVHTHQTYATAIGLVGADSLDMTEEEKEKLGGIGLAEYGLPGSDKLTNAVRGALESGAHIVLMIHHGVLICGSSREEAMERTKLLEEICKRNIVKNIKCTFNKDEKTAENVQKSIDKAFVMDTESGRVSGPIVEIVSSPELLTVAAKGKSIKSQLDDISQMIGCGVTVANQNNFLDKLKKTNAVIIAGVGAVVKADDTDDAEALAVLLQKMAVVKLHTEFYKAKAIIGTIDSLRMHHTYVYKYSKQKK